MSSNKERTNPSFDGCERNYCRHIPKIKEEEDGKVISSGESSVE